MRRWTMVSVLALSGLVTSVAVAQTIKVNKKGDYQVTTPSGEVVTVGKDGTIKQGGPKTPKKGQVERDSGDLTLGGSAAKEPRTPGSAVSCQANADLLVEHKTIEGVPVAISLTGSCDADVFNTFVDATNLGINVSGSGELRLTESGVRSAQTALNVSGAGDAVIEGAVIAGPIAINVSGTGDVLVKNSKIFGKVLTTGTGKFIDEGGNEMVDDHTKATFAPPEIKKSKAKK